MPGRPLGLRSPSLPQANKPVEPGQRSQRKREALVNQSKRANLQGSPVKYGKSNPTQARSSCQTHGTDTGSGKGPVSSSSFTLLPAPPPASWFSRVEMVGERKRGQVLYHWGCECLLSDRCLTDGFSGEGVYLRRLTGPSTPHGSPVFAMLTSCTVA